MTFVGLSPRNSVGLSPKTEMHQVHEQLEALRTALHKATEVQSELMTRLAPVLRVEPNEEREATPKTTLVSLAEEIRVAWMALVNMTAIYEGVLERLEL